MRYLKEIHDGLLFIWKCHDDYMTLIYSEDEGMKPGVETWTYSGLAAYMIRLHGGENASVEYDVITREDAFIYCI